jgi:hypothetical protein
MVSLFSQNTVVLKLAFVIIHPQYSFILVEEPQYLFHDIYQSRTHTTILGALNLYMFTTTRN